MRPVDWIACKQAAYLGELHEFMREPECKREECGKKFSSSFVHAFAACSQVLSRLASPLSIVELALRL